MGLWSLFVEVASKHFLTQVQAPSPEAAVGEFLRGAALRDWLKGVEYADWPRSFTAEDVFLLIPMEGLVNMYLCQLGREGCYVSITLALTVAE